MRNLEKEKDFWSFEWLIPLMQKLRRARERLKQTPGLSGKITLILRWLNRRLEDLFYNRILGEGRRRQSFYDGLLSDKVSAKRFIEAVVPPVGIAGPVLDAGCGTGIMPAAFSILGKPIVGIDIVQHDFWHRVRGASFVAADIMAMPFRESTFSLCICITVLEAVKDDELALREIRRVLRPHGIFLLRVANKGNLKTRLTGKMLYAINLREYEKHEITRLLEGAGFAIKSIQLTGFYPPNLDTVHRDPDRCAGLALPRKASP